MVHKLKMSGIPVALVLLVLLSACGGGSSSDGFGIDVPDGTSTLEGSRIGAEFQASQCLIVRIELEGTRVQNSCDQDVNVRNLMDDEFGPNFLVRANSTRLLGGRLAFLVACFAPKIPGGIASAVNFQCF